jgi:hypothetical protein
MMKWLHFPIWFAALFTESKSFVSNPVLGSKRLNFLGLHVVRVFTAHYIMRLRMVFFAWGVSKEDRKQFQENGYLMKTNFLPEDVYTALIHEIKLAKAEVRQCCQGDSQTRRMLLSPEALIDMPITKKVLNDPAFKRLMRYTAGHARMPMMHAENVMNGVTESTPDPQTSLHIDTFHPTMKFWLYLEPVSRVNGPFIYVPGSNRLTSQRLSWEYGMSLGAKTHSNPYTSRGSFRLSSEEAQAFANGAEKSFTVPGNTLLIANTFGAHARGSSDSGSSRLALWGSSRTNPFIPLPGLGFEFFNRLQYKVLQRARLKEDEKAAKRGNKSSWHRIEGKDAW